MNKLAIIFLFSGAVLWSSCNGDRKKAPDRAQTVAFADSVLKRSVWSLDTLSAPMGGWAALSFDEDSCSWLTTYYYDSDDLALTQKGIWKQSGNTIQVVSSTDTLSLERVSDRELLILDWTSWDNEESGKSRSYIFRAETPLDIKELCGEFSSVIDTTYRLSVSVDNRHIPQVVFSSMEGVVLKGCFVNDCILVPLNQVFDDVSGDIVIRRNPSGLIDLNYFSEDPHFDLRNEGVLIGDYK